MAYTDFTLESAEVELGVACLLGNLLAAFARAVSEETPSRPSP